MASPERSSSQDIQKPKELNETKSSLASLKNQMNEKFIDTSIYSKINIQSQLQQGIKITRNKQLTLREENYENYKELQSQHELNEKNSHRLTQEYLILDSKDANLQNLNKQIHILKQLIQIRDKTPFDIRATESIGPLKNTLIIKQKGLLNKLIVKNLNLPFKELDRFMNGLIDGFEEEGKNIDDLLNIIQQDPSQIAKHFQDTLQFLFQHLLKQGLAKTYKGGVDGLSKFFLNTYQQDFQNLPYYSGRVFSMMLVSLFTKGATKALNPKAALTALSASRITPNLIPIESKHINPFENQVVIKNLANQVGKKFPELSNQSIDKIILNLNYRYKGLKQKNRKMLLENLFNYFLNKEKLNLNTKAFIVQSLFSLKKTEQLYVAYTIGMKYIPNLPSKSR